MRLENVVSKITEIMLKEEVVEACCLEEKSETTTTDKSKIIMCAIINKKDLDNYLSRRISYLEGYNYILYLDDSKEEGIVCIFDDGVCLELRHAFLEDAQSLKNYKILFDRYHQLSEFEKEVVDIDKLVARKINEFFYVIHEFVAYYNSKNSIKYSLKKLEALDLLCEFYYFNEKDSLGEPGTCFNNLNKETKTDIEKLIRSTESIKDLNYLFIKLEKDIMQLPISIFSIVNVDFFKYVKKELFDLL